MKESVFSKRGEALLKAMARLLHYFLSARFSRRASGAHTRCGRIAILLFVVLLSTINCLRGRRAGAQASHLSWRASLSMKMFEDQNLIVGTRQTEPE